MSLMQQYRPAKFDEVVGQEQVIAALKNIAMSDGIPVKSIFLYGGWGCGKTTMARLFARAINCEHFKSDGDLCNECTSCKEAQLKNSQSYIELDSTKIGSVEAIRNMDGLFSMGYSKGRRLIVFDESATASKAAQNALLKVIEEGVPNTFIMFCSTDLMIPTIMSRSLVLELQPIPAIDIKRRVDEISKSRGYTLEENQLDAIALKSHGHMRDALSFLQLYEIAGPIALKSSLASIREFFQKALSRSSVEDVLHQLMMYPIVDIKNSLSVFIRDIYTSEQDFEKKIRQKGLANKIFNYFYTPTAQQALKSEYGIEILFRSFAEMINPSKQ